MASSAGQVRTTSRAAQTVGVQVPPSPRIQSTPGWSWGGGQSLCSLVVKVRLMASPRFKQTRALLRQEKGAALSQEEGGSREWGWELEQQWEEEMQQEDSQHRPTEPEGG